MSGAVRALSPDELFLSCRADELDFHTTTELEALDEVLGQDRAVEAIRFGLGIRRPGYNLFALGPTGVGKHSVVRQLLERAGGAAPAPEDVCYVNRFDEPRRPRLLRLPSGRGREFRDDVEGLVEAMREAVRAALESEDAQRRRAALEEELRTRQQRVLREFEERAAREGMNVAQSPAGIMLTPARDGRPLDAEEVQKLAPEERERLEKRAGELREELQAALRAVPRWQRELGEKARDLDRRVTHEAIADLVDELRDRWGEFPEAVRHLDQVARDVVENPRHLLPPDPREQAPQALFAQREAMEPQGDGRYRVNVLVDHRGARGAPVVYEDHPTVANLVGRIEHVSRFGALTTDFSLLRPGALHRANGGYLVLDARKVLVEPFAWEQLKRALRSREARVEPAGTAFSPMTTLTLEPEPLPLDVKVVLVGDRHVHFLLSELDPDFEQLFKVLADFEERIPRDPAGVQAIARFVARIAEEERLRPFVRDAVARIVERSARLAGHSARLSVRMQSVTDLLREADYWAESAGRDVVTAADVARAIETQVERHARVRDRLEEEILEDTIRITTEGSAVGEVNGLSVARLGRFEFGRPSRITARVHVGRGRVLDIEREVELGGAIHSKGVLILEGYLGQQYATGHPLALGARLVFEQSYGPIDGDSASLAELCALLSAIAELPVRQDVAVTGSIDQHGRVQPVGGVNEKIEGFFDVCRRRGLDGGHGVVIPAANARHLMLRDDVVAAARDGRFAVWPAATVDEALELLLAVPPGERDGDGGFPEGSVHRRVQDRLDAFAERIRAFARPEARGAPAR